MRFCTLTDCLPPRAVHSFRRTLGGNCLLLGLLLPVAALVQTPSFAYTGSTHTYPVPAGVTQLKVEADGSSGIAYSTARTEGIMRITAAPVISSISPSPGGLGQSITLTGTALDNPTALTINGANAFANIISNSGTILVVRVPATATASGNVSITTADGTVTRAFTVMAAPGNALVFDGVDDYVVLPTTLNSSSFTFEAWVNSFQNNGDWMRFFDFGPSANNWMLMGPKAGTGYGAAAAGNIFFSLKFNGVDQTILTSTPMPVGGWHHVAVTLATAGSTSGTIYLDGIAIGTNAAMTLNPANLGTLTYSWLGRSFNGDPYLKASLDEVRFWNTARTAAEVKADMATPATAPFPAALQFYLNMDQGAPAGTNTGLTTAYDLTSGAAATLTAFDLTGTTSNYVESYAMVVPIATPATGATASGFTATWTAPVVGIANSYLVDVSTNAAFTAPISGSPFTVTAPTRTLVVSASTVSNTYYYRVRAEKPSVTGQGAYSNTVTVCPAPVATAQSTTVTLDVDGNATVAPTAVNNGSIANCGPAAASALSVSPNTFSCADAVPATAASALSFNGSGQYLSLAAGNTLPIGNSSYTLEAWIKPTNMGNYGIIGWGNYGNGPQVNALRLFNDARGIGLVNYWWGPDITKTTADLSGVWHHVAATYDAVANTRTLYLDGAAILTDNPGLHAVPNANNLTIGNTNGTEYFNGSLDEVRVWSVARTAAQINAAKGIGLPGATPGLVAYYRLNEGNGTLVNDATGTAANQGSFVGVPTWTTNAPPVVNGVPVTLTVTDASGNTSTAPAVVAVSVPATPTTTWNGNLSISPLACQNWSYGQVPDAATNVAIPSGRALYPTLSAGTVATKDLTINSGGSFTTNGGTTLQVNGNLTNNGTATLSGTVQFVGTAATQTLSNSGSFTTLVVNKSAGTVQLSQNLTINSALTLTSGTLTTTGSYQVNLGGSASLSELETSYVSGKVAVSRTLAPGAAETFGGLGLTLTPASGSTAPGSTLVSRVTGTALTGVNSSASVQRYFDIQPATNTGLNVNMAFAYFDHELNGIAAANLNLFKSVSGTTGPWANQGLIALGTKTVSKTGITDFSIWTLGSKLTPLPVELTDFTATAEGKATVRLAWATATEKNSALFEVERSLNGTAFDRIGGVPAAGNSSAPRSYVLLDAKLLAGVALLYYRLRQVDADGTFTYSPMRAVALSGGTPSSELTLAPNPGRSTTLAGVQVGATVEVYDALGRLVLTAKADVTGKAALLLPANLTSGVYVVRTGSHALRLLVE
ncbi:MAG: C-terminal target protein [Hymenobacter sp.]|jgi:hypothetical protein|nr:C-terminal target protein [Hymenobacter sp.]